LGARSAAVFEAIFASFNIPSEYQQLILFLYGYSQGKSEFEAYLGELANAYYAEEPSDTQNWKRAAKAREQKFGQLLSSFRDWQDSRGCQLILYFPGEKIDGKSLRGKILLPVADLFARIYRESKSTSAFQYVREAKIKSVAENIILNEFESLPAPERRKPQSRSRSDRVKREITCLLTRLRNLTAELSEAERSEFWDDLDQIRSESESLSLLNKVVAIDSPIIESSQSYINSRQPVIDFKGDSEKLGVEVKTKDASPDRTPIGQTRDEFIAEVFSDEERQSPPVTLNQSEEVNQGSQGGMIVAPLLTPEPNEIIEPAGDGVLAIAAFESVGCTKFKWFFKNDVTEEKESDNNHVTVQQLAQDLPELIGDAERGGVSLVVRVTGKELPSEGILQLDDCNSSAAKLLAPFAFLTVETSPNNYQCWLAFHDDDDKAAARERLLAGLCEMFPGLDRLKLPGAGGAIRWPGSINSKPERDGWRVRIHSINPGRRITPSELDDAGLLADPRPRRNRVDRSPNRSQSRAWPDYEKCLRAKPTRSEADAQFAWIALRRGFSEAEIVAKLSEISEKAKESGEQYVMRTIVNVSAWNYGEAP
jgi:hypothetical protein